MTQWPRIFCLLLAFMPAAVPAQAEDDPTTIGQLHTLRVLLDKAAMDYQMFKGENGNPRYNESLKDTLDRISVVRGDLGSAAFAGEQQAQLQQLNQHVDEFLRLLRANRDRIANGGYEDYSQVDRMYDQKQKAQGVAATLIEAKRSNLKEKVPEDIQQIRDLSFIMQRMAASYIEQAASAFGTASRAQGDEKPVDQLAQEFTRGLKKLDLNARKKPVVQVSMDQVRRRWQFIEQSMLNYKENTVPFLVYRYANAIVDDLLTVADTLLEPPPGAEQPGGGNIPLPPNMPGAPAPAGETP